MSPDENQYREAEKRLWDFYEVTPTEHRVTLKPHGVMVRVQEIGSGPPALFIHGAPGSGSGWAPLAVRLQGVRCLLLDRPGTGLSEPLRVDSTNLPTFADGLVGSVLDALSIERAHLVVSSFGGYIALRSAAAQPKRVNRMVQLGSPAFACGMSMPFFMRLLTVGAARSLMDRATPTPAVGKWILGQIGHRESIKAGIIPAVIFDWYVGLQRFTDTMRNDGDMIGRLANFFRLEPSLTLDEHVFSSVVAPTLFLWGENDTFTSPKDAEYVASQLPDAKLTVLPKAGHLPWLDAPEVVAKATAEFLSSTAPAAAGALDPARDSKP